MTEVGQRVEIDGALFNFRNFSGTNSKFYVPGDPKRNFGVILDPKNAEDMKKDGWAVKFPDPRDEEEERNPYITVHIGYKIRPPRIVMVTSTGKVPLDQETVEILDWADIQNADIIFQAGHWVMDSGKTGTKAWLKTMVVTIEEDELERRYGLNDIESVTAGERHDG